MSLLLRSLTCFALLCSFALAETPTVVVTKSGYYVMTQDAAGTPHLEKAQVVVLSAPPTNGGPDVPPPPDSLNPTAQRVKELASAVGDPVGAQALSIVYAEVGKAAAKNKWGRDQVLPALKMASDEVLGAQGMQPQKWVAFRSQVSSLITEKETAGPVDYPQLCKDVSDGLAASHPEPALDPALIQLIIQLVLQVLQFFAGGGSVGGV